MNYTVALGLLVFGVLADFGLSLFTTRNASAEDFRPIVTTSELTVGKNRFAFGLLVDNRLIDDADVTLKLYALDGDRATLIGESKAFYRALGTSKPRRSLHRHSDGTHHIHDDRSEIAGVYVANLAFSRAGLWGVELYARRAHRAFEPVRLTVQVQETPPTPALGSPAPRSRNLTARDVKDLRAIDTSTKPDRRLHQVRIADAIAEGKPQLIVFATPQFCTTRMCGPILDVVRVLLPMHSKRVAFIHQEIWQDFASKTAFPTVDEWHLSTEPWIFIVDGRGIVRGKFEGLAAVSELQEVLEEVLKDRPGRRP